MSTHLDWLWNCTKASLSKPRVRINVCIQLCQLPFRSTSTLYTGQWSPLRVNLRLLNITMHLKPLRKNAPFNGMKQLKSLYTFTVYCLLLMPRCYVPANRIQSASRCKVVARPLPPEARRTREGIHYEHVCMYIFR